MRAASPAGGRRKPGSSGPAGRGIVDRTGWPIGTVTDPAGRGVAAGRGVVACVRGAGTTAALLTHPASTAALIVMARSGRPDNANFM